MTDLRNLKKELAELKEQMARPTQHCAAGIA